MKCWPLFLLLASVAIGCTSDFLTRQEGRPKSDSLVEELRLEVADLKQTLHNQKIELQLLEEKLQNQESSLSKNLKSQPKLDKGLENRVAQLEKLQEKSTADLRQLGAHANQTTASFVQYREKIESLEHEQSDQTQKLEELLKLKSTLTSINQAISHKSTGRDLALKSYRVKAGDTLEKIARSEQTSAEAIKKLNHLESDRIAAGQELKIPYDNRP